jgi:membrane fusion protein (multidrug efflux system)
MLNFCVKAGVEIWRVKRSGFLFYFCLLLLPACKKAATPPPSPPAVQVMEVIATNSPLDTEIIGQLDSPQNIEIRARVEGFVEKILFVEGTEVKEGDQLFLLDKKPFEQKLAAAQGALAEAKAALGKSEKDVARLTPLAQKHAVPQQDLDDSVAAVDVRSAGVLSAEADIQSAQINLGYCDMRAPASGLIGAKQVSIGDFVGKGQPTLLATISTLDPIWFYCNVGEVQYLKAQSEAQRTGKQIMDLPVSLILASGAFHPEKGKFVFIDRAVDAKTGTLRVRAEFPNTAKLLRPGMFGRLKVDLGARPESIVIPERALVELQGKSFVWVVGADNKTKQRPVTVGDSAGDGILIQEGLKAGERIIVEGLQKVRDGAIVKPMTAAQLAEAADDTAAKPAKE